MTDAQKRDAYREAQQVLRLDKTWQQIMPGERKPNFRRAAREILGIAGYLVQWKMRRGTTQGLRRKTISLELNQTDKDKAETCSRQHPYSRNLESNTGCGVC